MLSELFRWWQILLWRKFRELEQFRIWRNMLCGSEWDMYSMDSMFFY